MPGGLVGSSCSSGRNLRLGREMSDPAVDILVGIGLLKSLLLRTWDAVQHARCIGEYDGATSLPLTCYGSVHELQTLIKVCSEYTAPGWPKTLVLHLPFVSWLSTYGTLIRSGTGRASRHIQ
jgi:hypothetical protein